MKAIRMHSFGPPEVLQVEDAPSPEPAAKEVRVRAQAVGVNFMDVRMRLGLRPLDLPTGLGLEAVGVIDALGQDVRDFQIGDRVGYYLGPPGAYAEQHCARADQLVRIPEPIPADVAVCLLTKAITAQYLLRRTHAVTAGEDVLVHAAAGGVGLMLAQWAKSLGANVIGAVGSPEKRHAALANGCDHVVITTDADWPQQVRALTGAGVDVVYDSVGKDTFEGSVDALKMRGSLVCFGSSSGPLPPVDLASLGIRGSFKVMFASGYHFSRDASEIRDAFADVMAAYQAGAIRPMIHAVLPLAAAAEAHEALAGRRTVGAIVLRP